MSGGCKIEKQADGANLTIKCPQHPEYNTSTFHICGSSVTTAMRLASKPEQLMYFVRQEDAFLGHELRSMCHYLATGECKDVSADMFRIHNDMLQQLGPDARSMLGYHQVHVEAGKTCKGPAPSTRMSAAGLQCAKLRRSTAPRAARADADAADFAKALKKAVGVTACTERQWAVPVAATLGALLFIALVVIFVMTVRSA